MNNDHDDHDVVDVGYGDEENVPAWPVTFPWPTDSVVMDLARLLEAVLYLYTFCN